MNDAQKQSLRNLLRSWAPVVSERRMVDGDDIVVFINVRKPTRRLYAYRVSPDGTVGERGSYHAGVNQGVRVRPADGYWDSSNRSAHYVAGRLPRFRDVAEAVRFLADFPMIPTAADGALVQERDRAAGRMGSLGTVIDTNRGPLLDREGRPA